jgi:hypothetical protein
VEVLSYCIGTNTYRFTSFAEDLERKRYTLRLELVLATNFTDLGFRKVDGQEFFPTWAKIADGRICAGASHRLPSSENSAIGVLNGRLVLNAVHVVRCPGK